MSDLLNRTCRNCGGTIHIMCNIGQDYCSENCKKELEQTDRDKRLAQLINEGIVRPGVVLSNLGFEEREHADSSS